MEGTDKLKEFLGLHFHTKDHGVLEYFLDIKVARLKQDINLYRRKYATDLSETGLLGAKSIDILMDPKSKHSANDWCVARRCLTI